MYLAKNILCAAEGCCRNIQESRRIYNAWRATALISSFARWQGQDGRGLNIDEKRLNTPFKKTSLTLKNRVFWEKLKILAKSRSMETGREGPFCNSHHTPFRLDAFLSRKSSLETNH